MRGIIIPTVLNWGKTFNNAINITTMKINTKNFKYIIMAFIPFTFLLFTIHHS